MSVDITMSTTSSLIRVLAKRQHNEIISTATKYDIHCLNESASCIKFYIWTAFSSTAILS